MRASSSAALAKALERWNPVSREAEDGLALARQVFTVADTLDEYPSLARSLTNPTRGPEDRAGLARDVLAKSDPRVTDLMAGLVRERITHADDLTVITNTLGIDTVLAAVEGDTQLESVQTQLLDVSGLLARGGELTRAVEDTGRAKADRAALLLGVLGSQVSEAVELLVHRAVVASTHRSVAAALEDTAERAADRREQRVATVHAAVPLSDEQISRLARILTAELGHPIEVHVYLDTAVVGGMKVSFGDTVIDGTMSTRLDEAKRRLTG